MKVFITGATGLLGRAIMAEFNDSYELLGVSKTREAEFCQQVDLLDFSAISDALDGFQPDVIIHSAALRSPDVCENQQEFTQKVNVDASVHLAKEAERLDSRYIFISTDYVFDGTEPPYEVDSKRNALNAYGQSKVDAEDAVFEVNSQAAVLRIPVLYGKEEYLTESAVLCITEHVQKQESCTQDNWAVRFPTHVGDVAKALRDLVEKNLEFSSWSGIWHYSASEAMTKYDMACLIAEIAGLDKSLISPKDSAGSGAARPKNAMLSTKRIDDLLSFKHRSFRDGLTESLSLFL